MAWRENSPAWSPTESRDVLLGPSDLHFDLHPASPTLFPPSLSFPFSSSLYVFQFPSLFMTRMHTQARAYGYTHARKDTSKHTYIQHTRRRGHTHTCTQMGM